MSTATVTRQSILEQLADGTITVAVANGAIAMLDKPRGRLTCKVSVKGAVSVYGFGRWPVTLYVGQWEALFAAMDTIKAFLIEHDSELSRKG